MLKLIHCKIQFCLLNRYLNFMKNINISNISISIEHTDYIKKQMHKITI